MQTPQTSTLSASQHLQQDEYRFIGLFRAYELNENIDNLKIAYKQFRLICDKYPYSILATSAFGQSLNHTSEIFRREAQKFGVNLFALNDKQAPSPPSFVTVLDKIPVEILQLLAEHLQLETISQKNHTFETFLNSQAFKDATITTPEIPKLLNDFFKTHTVKCVGSGNSKVFQISKNTGNEQPYIVKLAYSGETTKEALIVLEQHLEGASILPSFASIPFFIQGNRYDLMVTPSAAKDIASYIMEKHKLGTYTDLESISIGIQMAQTLKNMLDCDVFFPDAKNANWQYQNGKLILADTKSYKCLPVTWQGLMATPYTCPPEYLNGSIALSNKTSLEKYHVYEFAVNMIENLTNIDIQNVSSAQALTKKIKDPELKTLLRQCVDNDASNRPFLGEVINKLEAISQKITSNAAIQSLLNSLSLQSPAYIFSDQNLKDYISSCEQRKDALDIPGRQGLIEELKQVHESEHINQFYATIKNLYQKKGGFLQQSGMQKAREVMAEFVKLSIEERLDPNSPAWNNVLRAFDKTGNFGFFSTTSSTSFRNTLDIAKQKYKDPDTTNPLHTKNP